MPDQSWLLLLPGCGRAPCFILKKGWVDPCCASGLCSGSCSMRLQLRVPWVVAGMCVGAHSAYFRVRAADFE